MAFINELISEEDKVKIDWSQFKASPYFNIFESNYWTVDHARNIFLVRLSARGRENEHSEVYAMYLAGKIIRFEADMISGKGNPHTGVEVSWKLFNVVYIPSLIKIEDKSVLDLIEAAMTSYGHNYRLSPVRSVCITFS
ncbi:hypothetical protein ACMYR3_02315 [Ampullimonas aquatilis]|uniref:hypothetical protein n=1 Tax=Ampullimonas aquatilis TaxID=1341549 RepID=UPI003C713538